LQAAIARTGKRPPITTFFSNVRHAMRHGLRFVVLLLTCCAVVAGGCGGNGGTAPAAVPTYTPIVATSGAWTWIDVPESTCDDGSATGFGVNPGSGPDVIVYFSGGGACWDANTCLILNQAAHGPYGKAQFSASLPSLRGSILDRGLTNTTATLVDVPYCTGDLHAGDNVATYVDASGNTHLYHHTGHLNALIFLARMAATWPSPRRLVLAGSSSGGFGALLNYDAYRSRLRPGSAYLIDDSGPPLPNGALPAPILADLFANWNLGALLDPLCSCRGGFEPALAALIQRYPNDRISLVSSEQDAIMRAYFELSATQFQADLNQTAADVVQPAPNGRYFFVPGQSHGMLGRPAAFTENVSLLTWLTQQVTDDPAWTDEAPP
jgi:hypothetical protein